MNIPKRYRLRAPRREGESFADRIKREKNWRYEEATVKHLLAHFQMQDLAQKLWSKHKSNSAEDFGRLALSDFQQEVGFPVWLGARRITTRRQPSIGKFLREFARTPMYRVFCETWDSTPEHMADYPVCAVFPVPKTRFMALHTFESNTVVSTTQITIPHPRLGVVMTMEPLANLLEALDIAGLLAGLIR